MRMSSELRDQINEGDQRIDCRLVRFSKKFADSSWEQIVFAETEIVLFFYHPMAMTYSTSPRTILMETCKAKAADFE